MPSSLSRHLANSLAASVLLFAVGCQKESAKAPANVPPEPVIPALPPLTETDNPVPSARPAATVVAPPANDGYAFHALPASGVCAGDYVARYGACVSPLALGRAQLLDEVEAFKRGAAPPKLGAEPAATPDPHAYVPVTAEPATPTVRPANDPGALMASGQPRSSRSSASSSSSPRQPDSRVLANWDARPVSLGPNEAAMKKQFDEVIKNPNADPAKTKALGCQMRRALIAQARLGKMDHIAKMFGSREEYIRKQQELEAQECAP